MENKKRSMKIALLLFIIVIILFSGVFLFLKEGDQGTAIGKGVSPFKVDQILIKVLVKEDESMRRPINIMDVSQEDLYVEVETEHLSDIVSVSDNRFSLKTGQTKTVYLTFSSFIEEKGIKQEPGIYVGSLVTKSNSDIVRTPVIAEIETKEVLFDANIELPIGQKQIKQGGYLDVQITLFNLRKIGLINLDIDYFVKDIAGNTIITETESIVIETQTSFVKTIHIPKNLNPGEYVFGTLARYGSSVGTSTLLFEVTKSAVKGKNLLNYCRDNISCWIILGILAIIVLIILSYTHYLIGAFVHHKIYPLKKEEKIKKREERIKEIKPEKRIKHKEFKHKKLLVVLLSLVIISSAIVYLFYSRAVTLEKLANCTQFLKQSLRYLWSLIINWLKNIWERILCFIKNLWKTILYSSSQRAYLYYALGVIGLIAIVCFIIIAKERYLFLRLSLWLRQRKKTKKVKEEKKIKKKVKKEEVLKIGMLANLYTNVLESFKELPARKKIIILIMLLILLLIIVVSVLVELGILSAGQFSAFSSNIAEKIAYSEKNIANRTVSLWNNTKSLLSNAYTNSLNWIIQNCPRRYLYYMLGTIIVFIAIIIAAKERYLFLRLSLWLRQRKKTKKVKEEKKVIIKKKEEPASLYSNVLENFKELSARKKIIIIVMLLILLLIIVVSVLVELGILSAEQLGIGVLLAKIRAALRY